MSVLSEENQARLEQLLLERGLIDQAKFDEARKAASTRGQSTFVYLAENKIVSDEQLTKCTADVLNLPYVDLSESSIKDLALNLLPQDVAERFMAVPLGEIDHRVVVAMLDANNVQAVDYLSNKIGRPVRVFMASETGIRRILDQYSASLNQAEVISDEQKMLAQDEEDRAAVPTLNTISQDSPISRTLTTIMEYAMRSRASDVHIEPLEKDMRVRCRIDGVLRDVMHLPKALEPALVSRVKILSNLKIDEHRIPQDGQFTIKAANRIADLRIAISPVAWGEQIIIRILDKTATSFQLEDLGYAGHALTTIKEALKRPSGMILTSGPTGSGKTTSLYALVQAIKNDEINIVTLEDPIEYKMDGVNQIQVDAEIGLDFATGLRSILRQDPDVVLVGEIRDKETASLAVQAALTGHLVFSTLHTNSAAGILPRLLDMDIEPFLIASTVRTVIGQRLLRRIDPANIESYQSDKAETEAINHVLGDILPKTKGDVMRISDNLGYKNLPIYNQNAYTLYRGKEATNSPSGFKGRVGAYEVLNISEHMMDLIMKEATSTEIEKLARSEGMITMQQDGYLKALTGLTTIEEVNRVVSSVI